MESTFLIYLLLLSLCFYIIDGASKDKKHDHQGVLTPFDGKHISYNITATQLKTLNAGDPVISKDTKGKSGRGTVIQDVNATPEIVMDRISDLHKYPLVVPNVKKVELYDEVTHQNGTFNCGAKFTVGLSFLTFGYFLYLTREPKFNTFYWTLDYRYASDFDDNTGSWQVLPHPSKPGWSRIVYTVDIKLYSWIPSFVVTFLTNTALLESTAWVKRESEKASKAGETPNFVSKLTDISSCFIETEHYAEYRTECAERSHDIEIKEAAVNVEGATLENSDSDSSLLPNEEL